MTKFHINPATGDAGSCSATKAKCPFGGEDDHYSSKEAARGAYENKMANIPVPDFSGNEIRFYEMTSPQELEKLATQTTRHFRNKPNSRIKIKDRYGYGAGVVVLSFDAKSEVYSVGKYSMRIHTPHFSSKSLKDVLSYSAKDQGYSDAEYSPMDWDE